MASFNTHKLETISNIASAAARLGLYCADNHQEFHGIRNASDYWPRFNVFIFTFFKFSIFLRFQLFFCSLALEQRANVIVKAYYWMIKNIPMEPPLLMRTLAAKGLPGRASIREPITITTMVTSSCQFLRIINVDLGGGKNVTVHESAIWSIISKRFHTYKQKSGGDLLPLQKVRPFGH